MLIIRMETVGERSDGRNWQSEKRHYNITRHWSNLKAPQDDRVYSKTRPESPYMTSDEVCGCRSIQQFHKWWPKEHFKDVPLGKYRAQAQIVILDVPDEKVHVGRTQVVFTRKDGRIVGTMSKQGVIKWNNKSLLHSSEIEKEKFSQSVKTPTSKPTRFKPITLS